MGGKTLEAKPVGKPCLPPPAEGDDDIYDDVQQTAVGDGEDFEQDIYVDAEGKPTEGEGDDLIYECCDDFSANAIAPATPSPPPVKRQVNSDAGGYGAKRVPPPPLAVPAPHVPPPHVANEEPTSTDYENLFYGKWSCQAEADNELAFKYGDIVLVLSREYDHFGWWVGKLNGKVGLVPREYLTPAYELVSS